MQKRAAYSLVPITFLSKHNDKRPTALAPRDETDDTTDPTADYAELIDQYGRLVTSAVRRVCSGRYTALIPDVEQDVRLALWRQLKAGKKIRRPHSYLYKVALTSAMAAIRRQHPELETTMSSLATIDYADKRTEPDTSASDGMQPVERARLLDECLALLPLRQGQALRAYLAGFNHTEVAHLFGWSQSAARHNIYRGLDALKQHVTREQSE